MPGQTWPWLAILLLGVWHGVNPGMGWLFATALGMQERKGGAVVRALLPLAAGHALAVFGAVAVGLVLGAALPMEVLQWAVAALLVGMGFRRLVSHRHPRYGGMRVSARQLAVWSALMASAHGAGLMVLPFVLRVTPHAESAAHAGHAAHAAALLPGLPGGAAAGVGATLLHTGGYLLVTAAIALVVYHKLGLRLLRTVWVNLDLVWGAALIVTGVATVVL